MKKLTEASVRDSAAMKQIAYLTMVFLPASFVAVSFVSVNSFFSVKFTMAQAVLGMNVKEIAPDPDSESGVDTLPTTLAQYFAVTIPLTLLTMWFIIALQGRWTDEHGKDKTLISRLSWPMVYIQRAWKKIQGLTWFHEPQV
jgi:predicted cobalt transporter CbtA